MLFVNEISLKRESMRSMISKYSTTSGDQKIYSHINVIIIKKKCILNNNFCTMHNSKITKARNSDNLTNISREFSVLCNIHFIFIAKQPIKIPFFYKTNQTVVICMSLLVTQYPIITSQKQPER